MTSFFVLLSLLGAGHALASDSAKEHCRTLHGVLTEEASFGPPGYGETPEQDMPLKLMILRLETPQSLAYEVPGGPVRVAMNVTRVGIHSLNDAVWRRVKELNGKRVEITGCLEEPVRPSERTETVMWIDDPPFERGGEARER